MEKIPDITPSTDLPTPSEISSLKPVEVVNINLGVLGHIDSGKTSLCKALTNIQSTASFDKNPQSQAQGITIDLGFSAFFTYIPSEMAENLDKNKKFLQYTLVDCPGHASLIKTIIAGAGIIDIMILIIDVTKGVQVQTAECIVLGELLGPQLVVV
jgi:selenocysteine-specific elongation factor